MTMVQVQQLLEQTNARITQLEQENAMLRGHGISKAKMEAPSKYDGGKEGLSGWLVQMRADLLYYEEHFVNEAQKVGYAASRLEGKALRWFEPTLKDYLEHEDEDDREEFTQEVFKKYTKFEEEIRKVFGDTDEKLHTQERLARLRQTKSAANYATKFRQDSLRAEINEEGLMQLFYDGLKEEVKDELYKADRPESLDEYIAMAIRIDDRLYARKQQRQGKSQNQPFVKANDKKKRYHPSTSYGTHAGAMDVSATQTKGDTKRDKSGVTCFNVGKKGHFRKECRSPKKDWKPVPGREAATIDKHTRVVEVAAASYTQEDLEYDIERAEGHPPDYDTDDDVRPPLRRNTQATTRDTDSEGSIDSVEDIRCELRRIAESAARDTVRQAAQRWVEQLDSRRDNGRPGPLTAAIEGGEAVPSLDDETDPEGDIAPPSGAAGMAQVWGLALIQDENGQWRTKNQGDTEGPNVNYLRRRVIELRGQNAELNDKIHELEQQVQQQSATTLGQVSENQPFNGPVFTGWGDMDPAEVRIPEMEYNDAWEYERMHGRTLPTREEYWQRHQYTSIGRTTAQVAAQGMGRGFMAPPGKDAQRLLPTRKDHVQVPWFQCVTHTCR
jgi:hypothetical protein